MTDDIKHVPMDAGVGSIFTYDPRSPEEKARSQRLRGAFENLPGVNRIAQGSGGARGTDYIGIYIEAEEYRAGIPETWEGLPVKVKILSKAEIEAKRKKRIENMIKRKQGGRRCPRRTSKKDA